ncbi:uncharacterized protein zgc:158432 isoform X1 [Callorhinchus milii]|uniref:Uncharacterized LOC103177688 n=1 Tax=Callorhinchus milii TaxID=7868 RepID=A0A4W3H4A6_CALMI|nr:uncharacterized protein zgc:158432 isoform X1 [Callorhinchus milii]|eukprot:gi/632935459/ref/XP_007890174.1/ PREDICTED: uncharacterized protein LOC103177688 [Callorhinchus milii]
MWIFRSAFPILLVLFASAVTEQIDMPSPEKEDIRSNSTGENCKDIPDFERCKLNTCPEHMPCYCKDNKEYCRCSNFKGPFGDYWYMGSYCDQEWSFLDLILVAVLPGVCLTLIVAITMHFVYRKQKLDALARVNESTKVSRAHLVDANKYRDLHNPQQRMSVVYSVAAPEESTFESSSWVPRANFSTYQPQPNMPESTFTNPLNHAQSELHLNSPNSQVALFQQDLNPRVDYLQSVPNYNNAFQGRRAQGLPQTHQNLGQFMMRNPSNYGRFNY